LFEKAIDLSGIPDKINMDKSGANKAGIEAINLRQVKYLNNIVGQNRRFIKKITCQMKEFQVFHSADATLYGMDLQHKFTQ
jgi:putative transposase